VDDQERRSQAEIYNYA